MTDPHPSKSEFFERVGALADAMVAAYGADFAMGALIITARFIAEGKPVGKMPDPDGEGA
ncbi:hypothetical protein [Inquilinus limosus]|uniref:Uncharacterized protein n=1 Tax=Inquilinus limosus TaxID=171674 RepID=A0A211ZVC2_9PROT|nr:hypothetical protein [Inquilinus limosus]OWJ69213.1 hypothetical protein BWR60_01390 [Inquilinus limosus]